MCLTTREFYMKFSLSKLFLHPLKSKQTWIPSHFENHYGENRYSNAKEIDLTEEYGFQITNL